MSQAMSMQNADKNPAQNIGQTPDDESPLQRMGNQHAMPTGQPTNAMNQPAKQVDFALLLSFIEPQLDKYTAMHLQDLYVRLKSNKEEFVRNLRSLVGNHMLKMAVYKLQQGQPSSLPMDNNAQKPRLLEHQSDSHGVHRYSNVNAIKQEGDRPIPMQGLGKHHQQQHMPFPQSSVANYGNTGGNYSSPNMNMSSQSFKQQTRNFTSGLGLQQSSGFWQPSMHKDPSLMSSMAYAKQHKYQTSVPQGLSSISRGQIESSKEEAFEMMWLRSCFSTSMNKQEPISVTSQFERQNVSAGNFSLASVGQKKPLEAHVSSLSKKQRVSGAFSNQSIEQRNDVTAVSGVNLREEEEQIFSGSKEDRVLESSRKVVQEEADERLILPKTPLQKKLAEIMAKWGIKNRSSDVERCLSLCVEERMRGLISNLIRLSRQRADLEKPTSDVQKQTMSMNQKAREEWEKKADAEKLQRADEPEGSGDGEDSRGKSFKVNKEEDGKMRTTTANVATRAVVGGDDMLSKWKLMAEQPRQKHEELLDPKQERCELVENVSPMVYFLRDEDSDAVECELVENVSPMSDSICHNMWKTRECAWRNTDTQESVERLQKLFDDDDDVDDDDVDLLDPKQEQPELVENASPVSDFLENFSSPQSGIICVQGYKVKRSNATILEAILKKHGDIAAKCLFKTNSVRSSFLEVVCEVVAQIQNNDFIEKMEELDCWVSDVEAATIDVTWLRAHLEAINKRKETSKKYILLMGMKESTLLLKKVVQVDLRERCSEVVAAQQWFEMAERCMRVLQLVEKNLNDNILESKAKIDSWVNHPVDDDDVDNDDDDVEPLDTKQEQCELDENASPMSDSLEDFSSPQSGIICVQGYKVKRSNATILEAIFKKHGDIAAKCVFKTNHVRSSFLEGVCEFVRRIQTNDAIEKMKDIECLVSDAEAANIDVSWLQTHLEAINKRKEASTYSLLMDMKENVILARKVAQIDMRERCAELVAAQQRVKKAERCVRVLHLVEKNLNDNILESKAKIDSWVNHPVL